MFPFLPLLRRMRNHNDSRGYYLFFLISKMLGTFFKGMKTSEKGKTFSRRDDWFTHHYSLRRIKSQPFLQSNLNSSKCPKTNLKCILISAAHGLSVTERTGLSLLLGSGNLRPSLAYKPCATTKKTQTTMCATFSKAISSYKCVFKYRINSGVFQRDKTHKKSFDSSSVYGTRPRPLSGLWVDMDFMVWWCGIRIRDASAWN